MIDVTKNLYDDNLNEVAGGQQYAENVMGVPGLTACTGAPRVNYKKGIYLKLHGVLLSDWEAIDVIKNKATRDLNPETEGFIEEFINSYNEEQAGDFIVPSQKNK